MISAEQCACFRSYLSGFVSPAPEERENPDGAFASLKIVWRLDELEMSAMVQTPKLQASEVWALYGGELEYCLGGEGEEEEEEEGEVREVTSLAPQVPLSQTGAGRATGGALLWLYSVCLAEVLPSGSNIVRKVQSESESVFISTVFHGLTQGRTN